MPLSLAHCPFISSSDHRVPTENEWFPKHGKPNRNGTRVPKGESVGRLCVQRLFLSCFFFKKLFLLSYICFSPLRSLPPFSPFYPLPWTLHSQFTQEILSFSPSYVDPCMSLLGSSLLSSFLELWPVGWFFFALCLKVTSEWIRISSSSQHRNHNPFGGLIRYPIYLIFSMIHNSSKITVRK